MNTSAKSRSAFIIPIILGLGLLALFLLPNMSGTTEDDWTGDTSTEQVGYSDTHMIMGLAGYSWAYTIAFIGIAIAAIGAFVLPLPNSSIPRKPVVAGGAAIGLLIPVGMLLAINNSELLDGGAPSFGIWLYALACIAATIGGFVSADAPAKPVDTSLPDWVKKTP